MVAVMVAVMVVVMVVVTAEDNHEYKSKLQVLQC
jgi:hypothetical protein